MQTEDDTTPSDADAFKDMVGDEPAEPAEAITPEEPEQEAEPAPAEPAEPVEPEAEATPHAEPDDKAGQVPAWRLRELREERDQIAARAEEAERRAQERERQLAEMERRQQEASRPEPPNLYDDPEGYRAYFDQQVDRRVQSVEQAVQAKLLDMTFDEQKEQNPEEFGKAWAALQAADQRGDPEVNRVITALNPGKALMRWHRQKSALSEVGDDLPGYITRKREEWLKDPENRKALMEQWRSEAEAASPGSSPLTDIPSINRAPGGGRRADTAPTDERDRYHDMFGPD